MAPSKIRGVLVDLSGTIHIGSKAIPGAIESLTKLRQSGKKIRFLTNTSAKSSETLLKELKEIGVVVEKDDHEEILLTSVLATKKYILKNNLKPFCLMEDPGDLAKGGVHLSPPHDCVVVGLAPSKFRYSEMNTAFRILLKHPNLIAIHKGKYLRDTDGELSMGPGGFCAALETAANCQSIVMGKPSKEFYHSAIWPDIPLNETCMIGDDIVGDIEGARNAGIKTTILVRTGKYRSEDEAKGSPSTVCDSFVEAVDFILNSNNGQDATRS